ncbi:hypothetical protein EB796_020567 [Bugula neritina]|uniref:Uncharacterized protein n=1 Tax=Bugula neritina TaxID=10212 RepID=A0A7J7J4U8_BUGNE|nr:hypothetical protein EB796_020567 [Bugula neritina]
MCDKNLLTRTCLPLSFLLVGLDCLMLELGLTALRIALESSPTFREEAVVKLSVTVGEPAEELALNLVLACGVTSTLVFPGFLMYLLAACATNNNKSRVTTLPVL